MARVKGGVGFFGANFVLDWLAGSPKRVVNLDNLTYAGNLETLANLAKTMLRLAQERERLTVIYDQFSGILCSQSRQLCNFQLQTTSA